VGKYVPTASVVPVADHAAEKKDDRLAGIHRLHFYSSFAWSVEQLTAFIGLRPPVISFNLFFAPRDSEAIAGWGTKSRSRYAMEAAARRGLPYIALEEGFLRSVGFGQQYVEPLSLIIDPVGIYYDSTRPSWLENLLAEGPLDDPKLLTRAEAAIDLLRTEKLTKFNTAPTIDEEDLDAQVGEDFVLIVDQTYNDESVLRSGAGPKPFSTMLRQARLDHPDRRIVIKSHTTVLNTAGPGYFTARNDQDDRVVVFDRDINPWQLLERCHAVYTVSSQLGFEALMAGKPVTCFGLPFYAGWGLTRDRVACPRRQRRRSLAQVFAAAYLLYPRYIDPYLGQRCEFERVAEILLHLRARNEMNRVSTSLAGLDPERLPTARRLYRRLGGSLTVVKHGDELTTGPEESRSRVLLSEDIATEIIGRGELRTGRLARALGGDALWTPRSPQSARPDRYFAWAGPAPGKPLFEHGGAGHHCRARRHRDRRLAASRDPQSAARTPARAGRRRDTGHDGHGLATVAGAGKLGARSDTACRTRSGHRAFGSDPRPRRPGRGDPRPGLARRHPGVGSRRQGRGARRPDLCRMGPDGGLGRSAPTRPPAVDRGADRRTNATRPRLPRPPFGLSGRVGVDPGAARGRWGAEVDVPDR
jgi:hypothetical protein